MAFQRLQMAALGLDGERIEAVTPATLPEPADSPRWQRWERPLREVEIALMVSHVRVWERVLRDGRQHLVLEDDAMLAKDVPGFLTRLEAEEGLDHVTLETRGRRKMMGRWHRRLSMRRLWQDRSGAAAYVVWPGGAAKLLQHYERRPGLADAVINSCPGLKSWQAAPALAIQLDQCARYGIAPAPEAAAGAEGSTISAARRPRGGGAYRLRRAAAQFRMLGRWIAVLGRGRSDFVEPVGNWPVFEEGMSG